MEVQIKWYVGNDDPPYTHLCFAIFSFSINNNIVNLWSVRTIEPEELCYICQN